MPSPKYHTRRRSESLEVNDLFTKFGNRRELDWNFCCPDAPWQCRDTGGPIVLSNRWNKTGTLAAGMLYVDNPAIPGDRKVAGCGERIGSGSRVVHAIEGNPEFSGRPTDPATVQ